MGSDGFRLDLNNALYKIAEKLDLDQTRFEKANQSYHAVGDWLNAENSPLLTYKPEIYSQGSFLLGTIVKPIDNDFDLDFVCLFENDTGLSSRDIFQLIGDRLKANATYASMLEPKNRCWRLEYSGDFHMDIIPAIPDLDRGNTSILVPDRAYKDQVIPEWTKSDPKGFFEWFSERMKVQYDLQLQALARKFQKEIEEIPKYLIKTELQLAIQLLKRHRDMVFQGEIEKDKPISIIITTLAGLVYGEQGYQEDLFNTLKLLAEFMPLRVNPSIPLVPNPTNKEEDFADKWEAKPEREQAFHEWVTKLRSDLDEIERCSSVLDCDEKLKHMFGENVVSATLKEINDKKTEIVVPGRFDVSHKKPIEWSYVQNCDVRIQGIKKPGVTKGVMIKEFKNNSSHLAKGLSLEYTAITNATGNYRIEWQVVNTGEQAERAGQLRGGFCSSSGRTNKGFYRTESTRYSGMHWIEAFVIKDDVCIARSGEFVVNIK